MGTHEDGLWDVLIACFLLQFPISPSLSRAGLGDFWAAAVWLPFWLLAFWGVVAMKRRYVVPRIGQVEFGRHRMGRLRRGGWLMFAVGTMGLALGALSFLDFGGPAWIHVARFGLVVLIGASLGAWVLDFPLLYLYGVLMGIAPVIGEWLRRSVGVRDGIPLAFGIVAAFVFAMGIARFVRFLKSHPLLEPESDDEAGEVHHG